MKIAFVFSEIYPATARSIRMYVRTLMIMMIICIYTYIIQYMYTNDFVVCALILLRENYIRLTEFSTILI